jgi:acyl-CoA thioesterase I
LKNLILYHVFSGQAFFSGVALVSLAAFLFWLRGRWGRTAYAVIAAGFGLALIAASSAPLPIWFYAVMVPATVLWISVEAFAISPGRLKFGSRWCVIIGWWLGAAMEVPHHVQPRLPNMRAPVVYVIGDSMSEGTGESDIETWPRRLAREHQLTVHNLARVAATAASASRQAGQVSEAGSLVIVEIGGNDVLGGTTPEDFERSLNSLLARLCGDERVVVLLELPLLPCSPAFGAVQRRVAALHGALVAPKRVLVNVLTTEGATLDSIHLTSRGHAILEERIWEVIRPAFGNR